MNTRALGFSSWRWPLWFGGVVGLLLFTFYASVAFRGLAAWTVGFVYIAYDSALLLFMVFSSRRAVAHQAILEANRVRDSLRRATDQRPSLAVVICARNERLVLPECLRALEAQTESADELIIVDDGSWDGTAEWLEQRFDLKFVLEGKTTLGRSKRAPHVQVWRKPNSGKAPSLNIGWRLARSEIVVTLDADTLMEREALAAIRDGFAEDPALGIAGGVLTPSCQRTRSAGFFQFFQTFEYARGFLWRLTWMEHGMLLLISGAFAAYRRDVLLQAGGFDATSWVEDYELTHRVYRDAYRENRPLTVKTLSRARGTTDAPATVATFLNQRRRWFAGFIATHFKYHEMVGNPRYGAIGRYMMCLKTLDLLLPIYALSAAVSLLVILAVHHGLQPAILKLIVAKLVFDLVLHAYSLVIYQRWLNIPLSRRLWLRSIGATLSEPFVFQIMRQLGAVLGWLAFLRGKITWMPQRPNAAPAFPPSPVSAA